MQPLVYYCRWHTAKLRLRGRDHSAVWGELVYEAGLPTEWTERFRYDLQCRELVVQTDRGETRTVLDDLGVAVADDRGADDGGADD